MGVGTSQANSAQEDRDFVRVTCVAVAVFLCVFWGAGCILGACVSRLTGAHKRALEQKRLEKELAEQDDTDWIDEEEDEMEDEEEVMRRSWQYRLKSLMASSSFTFLILSVVFVDLIVAITANYLGDYDIEASKNQQTHVDIFSRCVVLFFFIEIALRVYVWRYVTGSYGKFCKDPLNVIDLLLVIIDVVLELAVLFLMSMAERYNKSGDTEQQSEYAPAIRVVRMLRLLRLFRVARGVRALKFIMNEIREDLEDIEEGTFGDEGHDATPLDVKLAERAIDALEGAFIADALLRGARLEQLSWYHFSAAEQEQIERIFKIFKVGPKLHRKEVYAALRRFGCKVNVTQTRFLVHEFDQDGSGLLSLKQFIALCARAQLYQAGAAGLGSSKSKGLSMIEVRALNDVFDSVDEGAGTLGTTFAKFPLDGLLERPQLATAIQQGGYNPTQTELDEYMAIYDPGGSGWVTRSEFLLIMGRLPTQQGTFSTKQYAKIMQLFDMYDVGGSGLVSVTDLKALVWRLDTDLAKGALASAVTKLFPTGFDTPFDKQTVVSILSHVKARMEQYVRKRGAFNFNNERSGGGGSSRGGGGGGIASSSFSTVLDAVDLGEDLSRVPKVLPRLTESASALAVVRGVFDYCDTAGSGTVPRYVFKRCARMLGFHQVDSVSLDAVSRKIPPNKDGRMDFPELCALVGFILQNDERGLYGVGGGTFRGGGWRGEAPAMAAGGGDGDGDGGGGGGGGVGSVGAGTLIGTAFDEAPPQPEAIEDVLAVICEPTFLAQFTIPSAAGAGMATIDVDAALPAIRAYVDKTTPTARQLYLWMENRSGGGGGSGNNARGEVTLDEYVERIHDEAEDYYSHYERGARTFYEDQLFRWAGHGELARASEAFSRATQKSSVLPRSQLKRFLMELGYPVDSHKAAASVLQEFVHPKDKSSVLFPEVLHCVKTLSVVRNASELGRGDFVVSREGRVKTDALNDGSVVDDSLLPMGTTVDGSESGGGMNKKKKGSDDGTLPTPAGGFMLAPKKMAFIKPRKARQAFGEVDEEGYVKPKTAYELFVLTNPTRDQLELLYEWQSTMTDAEKSAFDREAAEMRVVYDNLKGGLVSHLEANETLKRKDNFVSAKERKLVQQQADTGSPGTAAAALTDAAASREAASPALTATTTTAAAGGAFGDLLSAMAEDDALEAATAQSPMHTEKEKAKASRGGGGGGGGDDDGEGPPEGTDSVLVKKRERAKAAKAALQQQAAAGTAGPGGAVEGLSGGAAPLPPPHAIAPPPPPAPKTSFERQPSTLFPEQRVLGPEQEQHPAVTAASPAALIRPGLAKRVTSMKPASGATETGGLEDTAAEVLLPPALSGMTATDKTQLPPPPASTPVWLKSPDISPAAPTLADEPTAAVAVAAGAEGGLGSASTQAAQGGGGFAPTFGGQLPMGMGGAPPGFGASAPGMLPMGFGAPPPPPPPPGRR